MNLFGVVSIAHDIEVRMSESVTVFQKFLGVRDIIDRMLGYLQAVIICRLVSAEIAVFRNRFLVLPAWKMHTHFPVRQIFDLPCSSGIVVAGVRAGEPGQIYRGTVDRLAPVIEHFREPVE